LQDEYKKRWLELWDRIDASGDAKAVFDDIIARYAEPNRAYHNFFHIEEGLRELDRVWYFTINPDAIELAWWLHDIIYNTKAKNNEEKSAEFALSLIKNMSLDGFGKDVAKLILATKHDKVPDDFDAQFIVDIDLSIFGQSEKRFDEYEQQIRKEYEWVPEELFWEARVKILKHFLRRPSIYLTRFFFDKYEIQAQQNLNRAIKQISNRLQ